MDKEYIEHLSVTKDGLGTYAPNNYELMDKLNEVIDYLNEMIGVGIFPLPSKYTEVKESLTAKFDAEYLQSKIDLHTKHMQEHGITSEQQLAELDEMRGYYDILTWQDIQKIIDIWQHTAKLTPSGEVRPSEDVFEEILRKFNAK